MVDGPVEFVRHEAYHGENHEAREHARAAVGDGDYQSVSATYKRTDSILVLYIKTIDISFPFDLRAEGI